MKESDIQLSIFDNDNFDNGEYLVDCFSAGSFCDDSERKALEHRYSNKLKITTKFNRQSVSYQLSKKDGLHSWLKYKEGFSADLVNTLLDEMQVKPNDIIMDPFMGSGTTALVCQMRGINCIGYDVMPISKISINAKAAVLLYDIKEIEQLICDIDKLELPENYSKETPSLTITKGAYPEYNAKFLHFIMEWIDATHYSSLAKNLLILCIINSLEQSSYTIKSGQYLGWDSRSPKIIAVNEARQAQGKALLPENKVRDNIANIKNAIGYELRRVLNDIKYIQNKSQTIDTANIAYVHNSVLYELPNLSSSILEGVITSPPYCNRYDYTRTYALELAFLGIDDNEIKKMRQQLLSCTVESRSKLEELRKYYQSINQIDRYNYINSTIQENKAFIEIINALKKRKENGDLNNNGILRMVEGYFTELAFIYAELYRICKDGATVAFVNDNVRYGGEVIPVDFLSCSFAEQFGFKVKCIYTLKQKKGNSSQQMAKYGRVALRKSITIWTK